MDAPLVVASVALLVGVVALAVGFMHMIGIKRANSDLATLHLEIKSSIDELKVLREQTQKTITELEGMHSETKELAAEISDVQDSISTRYLGEFPAFLGQIIRVINTSDEKMVISCDFPGYAKFSAPSKSVEYQEALEQAVQRTRPVTIDVLCLDSDTRSAHRGKQFPIDDWESWIGNPKHREDAAGYLARVKAPNPDAPTHESLTNALNKADLEVLGKPAFKGVKEVEFDHMPLYFWIADKKEAIFSIPTSSQNDEYGFHTSDPRLIDGLLEMHERYRTQAPGNKTETRSI